MSLPGWYPDPSGNMGHYRYWDGRQWSDATTTNPASPPPSRAAWDTTPSSGPPKGVIAATAVVVAVTLVIAVLWWSPWSSGPTDPPPKVAPSQPAPSQGTGNSPPSGNATLNCMSSNGAGMPGQQSEYVGAGMRYTAVPEYGFRFDASQFGWVDDLAAWGQRDRTAEVMAFEGIIFGGVRAENGFGPSAGQAATAVKKCMVTYGPYSAESYKFSNQETKDVTLSGMKGVEYTALVARETGNDVPDVLSIVIVDAGQPGQFGLFMSFHPKTSKEAAARIATARDSLKKV